MVVGLKDVLCQRGHGLQASSKILDTFESQFTGSAIQKLIDEDAIIIGRQNCDEFAMGSSNETSYYGPVRNTEQADMVVDVVGRFFSLRECDDDRLHLGQRCLYADMDRCTAPCETEDPDAYAAEVERVRAFLDRPIARPEEVVQRPLQQPPAVEFGGGGREDEAHRVEQVRQGAGVVRVRVDVRRELPVGQAGREPSGGLAGGTRTDAVRRAATSRAVHLCAVD